MRCRLILTSCCVVLLTGCSYWDVLAVRSQSPDPSGENSSSVRKVGDIAVPFGLDSFHVRSVGLVTGLNGTGSDPAPSEIRAMLIDEMQTRGVEQPNQVLRDASTALVVVEGWLPAGIQKGDRFDIAVRVPARSGTTSLHGGFLLETRLKQMAMLNNQFREGHLLALAKGPVLIDPSAGHHRRDAGATTE
ncbi:MAG: flagellar basal body P-ring protein FlgI, partial [Candidatus Nealsonbacteria bacterium]|nr:flagellar basal body P-ring protein FlgI [Candidatus Nealsonbacteria bacterium]